MVFWQALVIALVPSIVAGVTAIVGLKDLGLRRRIEVSKQFLALIAEANGRPADGRTAAGVAEQIATISLIADFALKEKLLRNAAFEGLSSIASWKSANDSDESTSAIADAADRALLKLKCVRSAA